MKPARALHVVPLLALLAIVGVSPLVVGVWDSFAHDVWGDRSPAGLDNYRTIVSDPGYRYSLSITYLWAGANAVLVAGLGLTMAVVLRTRPRLSRFLGPALPVAWGVPVFIGAPLWRALLHSPSASANLLTSPVLGFAAPLLVSVWYGLPTCVLVLYGVTGTVGVTAVEAARVDGADNAAVARSLYLSAAVPMAGVMALLTFLRAFREFTLIHLMTAGGPPIPAGVTERGIVGASTTVEIYLYGLFSSSRDFGLPAAASIITILLVGVFLAVYLLARSDRPRGGILIVVVAVSQGVFGGVIGFMAAAGYLLTLRFRRVLPLVAILHLGAEIVRISVVGVLDGLHGGIAVALLAVGWLVFREPRGRRQARTGGGRVLLGTGIGGWVFVIGAGGTVLVWLAGLSVSDLAVLAPEAFRREFLSLASFGRLFGDRLVLRSFLNSLLVASVAGAVLPVVTFPAAWYVGRVRPRAAPVVLAIALIVSLSGGMHALIPLYGLFRRVGLIGSYVPVIVISMAHGVVFSLYTMREYVASLPVSLEDAARLEGMGAGAFLTRIAAPLSMPTIVMTMAVTFVHAWNGFLVPLIFLTSDERYTVSVKLVSLVGTIGSAAPDWNLFAAGAVVNLVVVVALLAWVRRPMAVMAVAEYEE